MIISASYRTDIPAFYGEWFRNRFRAGYAKVVNPYGGKVSTVPLRASVDGFVFWTRNIGPFLPVLAEVRKAGIPFLVHYTVTGYPRELETSVVEAERSIALIKRVAAEYGPRAVVWRYDPMVFTSLTPAAFHLKTFSRLADALGDSTDECATSFANIYKKTARNLSAAARAHRFSWWDPPGEEKRQLASQLAGLAAERGLALTICSQETYTVAGTTASACVDARRLEDVATGWGIPRLIKAKLKGNRPGCLCYESRDIGEYDTCPHGCTYCYAVNSRTVAKRRFHRHDPGGEFLFAPAWDTGPDSALLI